jgi:hypothetical protein
MAAKAGELCGHCGTEVREGFTVCTGCGARRLEARPGRAWFVSFIAMLVVAGVYVGVFPMSSEISKDLGRLVSVGSGVLVFFAFFKKEVRYVRRDS